MSSPTLADQTVRGRESPSTHPERLLAAFIGAGLWFLVLPGTFLGVWNLLTIAHHRSALAPPSAWLQAHGQAQVFGWVGSFIFGISLILLPKLRRRPPIPAQLGWTIWWLWTLGVMGHWWAVVTGQDWRLLLPLSGLLELVAFALVQYLLVWAPRRTEAKPQDLGSRLGMVGFVGLALALAVNEYLSLRLALNAPSPRFPLAADRMLVLLAVWGFLVPLAFSYSTRLVHGFLNLPPIRQNWAGLLFWLWVALYLALLLERFIVADLVTLALAVTGTAALRIFSPALAPAGNCWRPWRAFTRLAFAWLILGASLAVVNIALPRFIGLGGASRHAVTVGFVALLVFSVAPRLLPSLLRRGALFSSRLALAAMGLLALGCTLRVLTESCAYATTNNWAWRLLPISAWIEFGGVLVFAANLALTLRRPLQAGA